MVKQHLKRLGSPNSWPIAKKTLTFIARPLPGPNNKHHHLPIAVALRDLVGVVATTKEAKFILRNKDCLIDQKPVFDNKQPIGLLGVISLHKLKESYRLTITKKNKLRAIKIEEKEAKQKITKIIGKTSLSKGKTQLNLFDGRNLIVEKDTFAVGDSLCIELPSQKIIKHVPLKKGALIFLDGGSHVGTIAVVSAVDNETITVEKDDALFKTKRKYAIVIGVDKPLITVQ